MPNTPTHISRRSIAKGAVWAAPVVIASQTAAYAAASTPVPWPHVNEPFFVDQKDVTSQTNDGNQQGNFKFIVPTQTEFPEIEWTVKIIPIKNDAGKLITKERKFEIRDLVGGGSTLYQNFERKNVNGPVYDPKTGVETITFTTPVTKITRGNGINKTDTSIGFRVWLGGPLTNWGGLSSDRGDKLVVTAVANGKQVVDYDSISKSSPDRGSAYDGRL